MQYEKILLFSLPLSILLLLVSIVTIVLTTHYWILCDWIMSRWLRVVTDEYNARTQSFEVDDTIVYYSDPDTDATIISGCLCLATAVVSLLAWVNLRKGNMDLEARLAERRFWVLAVWVTSLAGTGAALASIVLHFTMLGDDEFGCSSATHNDGGSRETNMYCTREMGACNFVPRYAEPQDEWASTLACGEAVTVKWMQIVLILLSVSLFAVFTVQSIVRRKTRHLRAEKEQAPPAL